MSTTKRFAILWVFGCLSAFCTTTSAEVISLVSSKDNTLYEDFAGTLSNGLGAHLFAGKVGLLTGQLVRRGLLVFDIAGGIPADSTVNSVMLKLTWISQIDFRSW